MKLSLALIFLLGAFGLLYDLDDRLLWGDEAETAVLAQRILEHGLPLADDGVRPVALEGREWNARGVWIWSPWLDEYVAAGSFALFGVSTWSARFPFALVGLAALALFARWVWRCFESREITVVATLLFATSVPFLLLARQCRYHALVIFASVWLLIGLQAAIRRERGASLPMAGALVLQFYANYVTALGSVLGLAVAVWALREHRAHLVRPVGTALAILALLAAPWLLYAGALGQAGTLSLARLAPGALWFTWQLDQHVVPLALLVPLALFVRRRARGPGIEGGIEPSLEAALLAMVVVQVLVVAVTPLHYFRYLGPVIPVLLALSASVLVQRVRPRALRWSLVALLVATGLAHDATGWLRGRAVFELPYFTYLQSITRPYEDRSADVVSFLAREARPGQTVLVADPELPLTFYTQLRVIDARLGPVPPEGADWVLPRPATGLSEALVAPPAAGYETLRLDVRASPRGGSRPDPNERAPFTVGAREEYLIYRRRGG